MTARDALALGTIGGARVLGREDEIGSLEPGKLADSRCGASTGSPTPAARTPSRPWCSGPGRRWPGSSSGERRSSRTTCC